MSDWQDRFFEVTLVLGRVRAGGTVELGLWSVDSEMVVGMIVADGDRPCWPALRMRLETSTVSHIRSWCPSKASCACVKDLLGCLIGGTGSFWK